MTAHSAARIYFQLPPPAAGFTEASTTAGIAAEELEGAAAMDRHFRLAPPLENAPVLAAFVDRYYANVRNAETKAVFAYDERLRLLPSYLQQLIMESNGKSVTLDGSPVGRATSYRNGGIRSCPHTCRPAGCSRPRCLPRGCQPPPRWPP